MPLFKRTSRALSAKLTRVTLDRFVRAHASSGRTLDLGAQNGPYAASFPNRLALDIRQGVGVQILGDAQALGLRDAAFDVVLCTEVLEHLPEPQKGVDEAWRVLKPGGMLLLTTRFLFPIHDAPHDYFRFTKYGLRHLLRHFEILELHEETDSVRTLAVLAQRLGMQAETLGRAPLRAGWLIAAQMMRPFSFLITREYGDSRRQVPETGIMTSGYHVACRKPGVMDPGNPAVRRTGHAPRAVSLETRAR
jgi:SAM-dependent methyltransferase